MNRDHHSVALILALLLILSAGRLQALPEDRDQPIKVESDRAEHNQREGIMIYEGSVQMSQGSLVIRADKITIHFDTEDQVERVLAEGSPAYFEQKPAVDEPLVTAEAKTIRYDVGQEQLQLLKDAWLKQEQATLKGNLIDYDIANEIVKAEGQTGSEQPRIEMVLPPQNRTEQE